MFNLVIHLIFSFFILTIYQQLLEKRLTILKNFGFSTISSLVMVVSFYYPVVAITIGFLLLLVLLLISKNRHFLKNCLLFLYASLLYSVPSLIIIESTTYVFSMLNMDSVAQYYELILLFLLSVVGLAILLLSDCCSEAMLLKDCNLKNYFVPIFFIAVAIFYLIKELKIYKDINAFHLFFLIALSCFLIASVVFFFISYREKMVQEKFHLEKYQLLKKYTEQLEELTDEVFQFRHDYINQLFILKNSIEEGNIVEIKKHYNTFIEPSGVQLQDPKFTLARLKNIQSSELKSVISAKLFHAEQLGIQVNVEIPKLISDIYADISAVCSTCSIILDNAIEEAVLSSKKSMQLTMVIKEDVQEIAVKNSCSSKNINLKMLARKGYSTKGENRGLGLYLLKQELATNPYVSIRTTFQYPYFSQTLSFKRRSE